MGGTANWKCFVRFYYYYSLSWRSGKPIAVYGMVDSIENIFWKENMRKKSRNWKVILLKKTGIWRVFAKAHIASGRYMPYRKRIWIHWTVLLIKLGSWDTVGEADLFKLETLKKNTESEEITHGEAEPLEFWMVTEWNVISVDCEKGRAAVFRKWLNCWKTSVSVFRLGILSKVLVAYSLRTWNIYYSEDFENQRNGKLGPGRRELFLWVVEDA